MFGEEGVARATASPKRSGKGTRTSSRPELTFTSMGIRLKFWTDTWTSPQGSSSLVVKVAKGSLSLRIRRDSDKRLSQSDDGLRWMAMKSRQ